MSAVDTVTRTAAAGRARGFTLIEVLVVVAILALLAAILIPSLSRARGQAKIAVCKVNLHDLGTAMLMYTSSYRNYFPLTANSGEDNYFALHKARLLANPNVLVCPATKHRVRAQGWDVAYHNGPEGPVPYYKDPNSNSTGDLSKTADKGRDDSSGGHSYEYQGCYDGSGPTPDAPYKGQHRKITHFPGFHSQLAVAFEADPSMEGIDGWTPAMARAGCFPSRAGNGNNCPQPWDNHGADGANFLFTDGHVEFVKKLDGFYNDLSAKKPGASDYWEPSMQKSTSYLIDQVLIRTQYPWQYHRR